MKPKLFFVGDNQKSENWGRGASIALRQLLSKRFEIIGSVAGESFDLSLSEAGYVGTLLPQRYYRHFRYMLNRRSRRPIGWYIKLEEAWGARDFISETPLESVRNLIRYKEQNPELARIFESVSSADLIVIDGDGDIILSNPPRRSVLFILAMMELGIHLNKPVFLVNSMISDCPQTGRNPQTVSDFQRLLRKCSAVTLRDPESLDYVKGTMPEVKSSLVPDSLFSWFSHYQGEQSTLPRNGDFILPFQEESPLWGKLDFSKPYICIGGGASAAGSPEQAERCYSELVDSVEQLGYPVYLTENDRGDGFLRKIATRKSLGLIPAASSILTCGAVVANARLFISGRYHASILASLGGTPCIFLGTHSHKNASLARILNYENQCQFSAFPNRSEIDQIIALGSNYLGQGEALRTRVREVAQLRCDEASALPGQLHRSLCGELN